MTGRRPIFLAAASFGGVAALLALALFLWPDNSAEELLEAGTLSQFEVGEPVHFEDDHVWLIRLGESEFRAFYDRDPTFLCPLEWHGDRFKDFSPLARQYGGVFGEGCGGSLFAANGEAVFGPASFGLSTFPVSIEGRSVVLHLDALSCGEGSPAEDCVTYARDFLAARVESCRTDPHDCHWDVDELAALERFLKPYSAN